MTKTIQFTAGVLIRRQVRQALGEFIFKGYNFTYLENKGWIDSTFTLKGCEEDMTRAVQILNKYYQD